VWVSQQQAIASIFPCVLRRQDRSDTHAAAIARCYARLWRFEFHFSLMLLLFGTRFLPRFMAHRRGRLLRRLAGALLFPGALLRQLV
jgi:hypothetical protein